MRHLLLASIVLVGCAPGVSDTPGVADPTSPTVTLPHEPPAPDEEHEMYGFSWLDDLVAGMPRPGLRDPLDDDLGFLQREGIALLVSLTVDPVDEADAADFHLDVLHLPIEDMQPPTHEQQVSFVGALQARRDEGQAVGVHCTAGLGRTGTMLATWLVAGGWDPQEAIDEVRRLRPGSIETEEQEQAVHRFAARR